MFGRSSARTAVTLVFAIAISGLIIAASAVDDDAMPRWPSQIQFERGLLAIYQPQVDSMSGNMLWSRSAISWTPTDKEPVFGIARFASRIEVDRDARSVRLVDIGVTDVRLPGDSQNYAGHVDSVITARFPNLDIVLSLDELLASVAASESERKAAENINTDPPVVLYESQPAILVVLDGDPIIREIEGSSYRAVINTPYPLLIDRDTYWLNVAEDIWYRASSVDGPWSFASPPSEVASLVPPPDEREAAEMSAVVEEDEEAEPVTAANAPKIIAVTEPTELIVTEGEPEFETLTEGLQVVSNTDNEVFRDPNTLLYYTVLSGRWYRAGGMSGPWIFIGSDELPEAFKSIPPDNEHAIVLAYVAGTDEAREALVDAQIPQTATVQRGEVDLDVEYDGDPKFTDIEGTDLERAVNTGEQIIKSENRYYCVEDGVWYVSDDPDGPWEVSDHVPEGVADIPPSDPTYNVKYVYVYDSTPDVVYVGYTPGYMGSYVYGPTIVYGTGWYYPPYVSPYYYYPYHSTWGFHVSYNPWTGWGCGLSWSSGPFHFSFYSGGGWGGRYGWYGGGGGYWGAGGYRPRVNHLTVNRNININHFNRNNIYARNDQRARVSHTQSKSGDRARVATSQGALAEGGGRSQATRRSSNDVYAGRDGNVYKRDGDSWSKRENGQWSQTDRGAAQDRATQPSARPSTGAGAQQPSTRPSTQQPSTREAGSGSYSSMSNDLDRSAQARQRSTTRNTQYDQTRSAASRSSSTRSRSASGGARGGGRRR